MNDKKFNDELIDVSDNDNIDVNLDIETSHKKSVTQRPTSYQGRVNTNNIPQSNIPNRNIPNGNDMQPRTPTNPNGWNQSGINPNNSRRSANNGLNGPRRQNPNIGNAGNGGNPNQRNQNNNRSGNNPQGKQGDSRDKRSLGQKAQDAKKNIQDKVDRVKNSPQNLKNKVNDTKKNISDKAKKAKENWNNRPKNFKDFKNKGKDLKKNLAQKAKQSTKNLGKKALDGAKDKAKETFDNSSVGNAINKGKNIVNKGKDVFEVIKNPKKLLLKIKIGLIAFAIILGIILLSVIISYFVNLLHPGKFDVKDEEEYENYAEVDKKTLEKLKEEFSNSDIDSAALGMATVVYPYFSQLFDGNVITYLSTSDNDEDDEEDEIVDVEGAGFDNEDIEKEEGDQEADDMYLLPFRNSKVRNRLKKVLNALNGGQDKWEEYLKDTYFKKDKGFSKNYDDKVITGYNGYKKLFKAQINSSYEEDLEDAIIKNLQDIKYMFLPYVIEGNINCTSSTVSLGDSNGEIETDSNGYVSSNINVCVVNTNSKQNIINQVKSGTCSGEIVPLEKYVIGVTYQEMGLDYEGSSKAQMIATQSFLIGRSQVAKSSKAVGVGYGKVTKEDGSIIYYVKNNTDDQAYCDPEVGYDGGYYGCSSGKPKLSAEKYNKAQMWYQDISKYYVYNESDGSFGGGFCSKKNTCKYCFTGYCLIQTEAATLARNGSDYNAILGRYYSATGYTIYDSVEQNLSIVSVDCKGTTSGGCSIASNDFKYYSQRSYNDSFCGRTDATINTSGCGTTSMAMVLANLVDENIDPLYTMNEAANAESGPYCGYDKSGKQIVGTDYNYFEYSAKQHGFDTSDFIVQADDSNAEVKVKSTLNSGGLVIANVGNGWSRKNHTIEVGHYLVVRGISSDGTLILADPMHDDPNLDPNDTVTFEELTKYMLPRSGDTNTRSFFLFVNDKSKEIKEKYCLASATGESGEVTGYLGNPLDPSRQDVDYHKMKIGNSACYPKYCGKNADIHGGVDLPHSSIYILGLKDPVNVYAMDGGYVSEVTSYSGNCYTGSTKCSCSGSSYGISVIINHGDTGYSTVYAHLSQRLVNVGDSIAKGQQIGVMGNTGCSSGAHLHIELRSPLYAKNGRNKAKGSEGKGLMNPTKYINQNISYIGQGK